MWFPFFNIYCLRPNTDSKFNTRQFFKAVYFVNYYNSIIDVLHLLHRYLVYRTYSVRRVNETQLFDQKQKKYVKPLYYYKVLHSEFFVFYSHDVYLSSIFWFRVQRAKAKRETYFDLSAIADIIIVVTTVFRHRYNLPK